MSRRNTIVLSERLWLPSPETAINFVSLRSTLRSRYFCEALSEAVTKVPVATINSQLAEHVPANRIQELAARGIRGEVLYPVPCILEASPFLIGYYRLLLGLGFKTIYRLTPGWNFFKSMEESGILTDDQRQYLPGICSAFIEQIEILADAIGISTISHRLLEEIQLVTLGPSFQGRRNVSLGTGAINEVRRIIEGIVSGYIDEEAGQAEREIVIRNSSGRPVIIRFAADPDVAVIEKHERSAERKLLSIEVKGGKDDSNLDNRLGEAEKSHIKARNQGFIEFWTVVNTPNFNVEKARRTSPTTRQFFELGSLCDAGSEQYVNFREGLESCLGI